MAVNALFQKSGRAGVGHKERPAGPANRPAWRAGATAARPGRRGERPKAPPLPLAVKAWPQAAWGRFNSWEAGRAGSQGNMRPRGGGVVVVRKPGVSFPCPPTADRGARRPRGVENKEQPEGSTNQPLFFCKAKKKGLAPRPSGRGGGARGQKLTLTFSIGKSGVGFWMRRAVSSRMGVARGP